MKPESQQLDSLPTHYSVGLGELIGVIWRRKICLLVSLFATLALGGVYFVEANRLYEVKCRLLVEKQELPLSESSKNYRSLRDLEFLGTQAEIIGSSAVMAPAIDRVHWPVPSVPGMSPVAMLKDRLSVRPVLGTNVLSISLQAENPERAVQAVDALIESYRGYVNRAERAVHLDVLEMLTKNEKEVRNDLHSLEEQYRELRVRSPLISTFKNGIDIQLAHVDEMGRRLAETSGRRVELENQMRTASAVASKARAIAENQSRRNFVNASLVVGSNGDDNEIAALGELDYIPQTLIGANLPGAPDFASIQNQLVRAKSLERELYTRFGHKHPEVRAIEEQIASLKVEELKAIQSGHELLRRELETVTANEKQLSELCKAELNQTKLMDSFHLQEQQMIGQIARNQAAHDSIVSQLRQWKLTGEIASDGALPIRISVLEAPVVPLQPVWPSPRILFGICTAFGLITGFSLMAFLEQRNRSMHGVPQTNHPVTQSPQLMIPSANA